VLAIQEAVTQAECAEIRDLLTRAAGGTGRVAVDLAEVPFMDSAVLELFLQMNKECSSRGGRLKLMNPSPNCQEILRLTDLSSRFEVQNAPEGMKN
jgi:anti-anti-sigma factor